MRLLLQFILISCLVSVLSACASNPPRNPDNVCDIFKEKRSWYKTAVKAEEKWGTSMHIPLAFMYQESAFGRKARPPRRYLLGFIPWKRPTTAYGYAQVVNGTWREYIGATGEYWRSRDNFTDATDFIHWYITEAERRNGVSRSDAFNLYMNYHEGPAGFARNTQGKKPWLHKVANGVQKRSQKYATQYSGCRESLQSQGFFSRLFGWMF